MYGKISKFKFVGQIICVTTLLLYCNGCASNNGADEQPTEYLEPVQDIQQTSKASEDANDVYTKKIDALEKELERVSEKMENLRQTLYGLAHEYGTLDLSSRQNLMLERVKSLLTRLIETETGRIKLETRIQVLESRPDKTKEEEQKIADMQLELEMTRKFEERLSQVLKQKDNEAIDIGRRQLMINEYQERLEKSKEMHDLIMQRIQKMESARSDSQT